MYASMADTRHIRWWNLAASVLEVARFVYSLRKMEAVMWCQ